MYIYVAHYKGNIPYGYFYKGQQIRLLLLIREEPQTASGPATDSSSIPQSYLASLRHIIIIPVCVHAQIMSNVFHVNQSIISVGVLSLLFEVLVCILLA